MKITTSIRIVTAALIVAGSLVPVALAGGEPKNEWPFTRPVGDRTTAYVQVQASENAVGVGEAKNELPFTRPVVDKQPVAESVEHRRGEERPAVHADRRVAGRLGQRLRLGRRGDRRRGRARHCRAPRRRAVLTNRGSRGRKIGAAATR